MVWTEVTRPEQLWRFQTGHIKGTKGVTTGTQYVVFKTKHRSWLKAQGDKGVTNGQVFDGQEEKFQVEFLDNGDVALKTWTGLYWGVHPGTSYLSANSTGVGEREKFKVFIDQEEEHVVFKSFAGKFVTAEPDGRVEATHDKIPTREGWELFRGWKRGTSETWSPVDNIPYWHEVKDISQIWRFQTGHVPNKASLTAGLEYIVLMSIRGKWLSADSVPGSLRHDRHKTDRSEKFEVEFLEDGHVTIKCANGLYLSALPDGKTEAIEDSVTDTEKFKLFADASFECLAVQSTYGKWLSAYPNGQARADADTLEKIGIFRGWKKGNKEEWQPKDQWEVVGYLDNRSNSDSGQLKYIKTIGTSLECMDTLTTARGLSVEIDPIFVSDFTSRINHTTEHNWSTSGSDTWQPAVTASDKWPVPPGHRITLCQIKGTMGPFVVRPDHFLPKEM